MQYDYQYDQFDESTEHGGSYPSVRLCLIVAIVVMLIIGVSCARGGDRPVALVIPQPLVIPSEPQEVRLVFPEPVGSAASAACPMDASVIVRVIKDGRHKSSGSGTCVRSGGGSSLIITAAHLTRGDDGCSFEIDYRGKRVPAKALKTSALLDLCVLQVSSEIPCVAVSGALPEVGTALVSIGGTDGHLVEHQHRYESIDKTTLFTDGQQIEGRSGGGLFWDGRLIGVIHGRVVGANLSAYVPASDVLAFLPVEVGSSAQQVVDVEFWTAPFNCGPCRVSEANIGSGNERLRVTKHVGPPAWMTKKWLIDNPTAGYPMFVYKDQDGNSVFVTGITTLEQLEQKVFGDRVAMSAVAGGEIVGGSLIESALAQIEAYAGDGASISVVLRRAGAKPALMVGQQSDLIDICGTSGRIEIAVTSQAKLPVDRIAFRYRLERDGEGIRKYVTLEETEFELPEDGVFSSASPVGGPLMTAWTVMSAIQTIYAILTPTVDVWLGDEVKATATFSDGKLAIDTGANPPAVRLHWRFLYGLLNAEYSRPLTGVVISKDAAIVQFHKSRIYRDVTIPIKQ